MAEDRNVSRSGYNIWSSLKCRIHCRMNKGGRRSQMMVRFILVECFLLIERGSIISSPWQNCFSRSFGQLGCIRHWWSVWALGKVREPRKWIRFSKRDHCRWGQAMLGCSTSVRRGHWNKKLCVCVFQHDRGFMRRWERPMKTTALFGVSFLGVRVYEIYEDGRCNGFWLQHSIGRDNIVYLFICNKDMLSPVLPILWWYRYYLLLY